ncbi:MAG: PstS family phosphate ABC transporter substrate-binding protein [Bacillus sp. (in: firmicutes)]
MKGFKRSIVAATMIASLALVTACGSDTDSGNESNGNNEALSGAVTIDGSSTVYPIMEAVSEEYMLEQPDVQVSVGFSGTGGGFKKFIAGETDMSNASRLIKDEEAEQLEANGVEYTEFELAKDGISIVVNKDNDWVDYLTVDELKALWVDNGETKLWSDIREGWPAEEVKFYSPGTDSGTFDYFNEVILEEQTIVQTNLTLSEDDNTLVTGVSGDANAIGFFGYAYYAENQDQLKIVPIDNGNGAVEPNNETIEDGSYSPLSRAVYTYVSNESVAEKSQVADFVQFTLENAGELAGEVGYVSLPEEKYEEALQTLESLKE